MGKVAVVGVVGRTNAGKSTLVNALVGEKVSIVSPVEQTTRNTIRGIVADPRGQLVLLDTPGLHKAVDGLGRLLNRMARRSAAGTDITCVVFDASQPPRLEDEGWMNRVASEKPEKAIFVLNKSDAATFDEKPFREAWEAAVAGADGEAVPPMWVTCSAIAPEGAAKVLDAMFSLAKEGEELFDGDTVTDYPRKLAIADSIREKYLSRLYGEVPHELGVLVRSIDERGGAWKVAADVLVSKESQKPIAIGRGAATVKFVRKNAERELSEIFGVKVRLELKVRVERNWMKNDRILAAMGYLGELV